MIYLDNNATTALAPEVAAAMAPFGAGWVGNASSRHQQGRQARRAIDQAREQIAQVIGGSPERIVFTSGATEANNWAIRRPPGRSAGVVYLNPSEHPSALEPAQALSATGWDVQALTVDGDGSVQLPSTCPPELRLVVVQLANSETGVIQSIEQWTDRLPARCWRHCDITQAVGKIPVDVAALGASSYSLSAHKMHGPTGIGALILRPGAALPAMLLGGQQQGGLRAGTEPIASIVGFGAAVALAGQRLEESARHMRQLRDHLEAELQRQLPDVVSNGAGALRLPNTSNISFLGAKAEAVVLALDLVGVCCSTGVACASGAQRPSAVLQAMGLPADRVVSAVRFSLSRMTTRAEIDAAITQIVQVMPRLRNSVTPFP